MPDDYDLPRDYLNPDWEAVGGIDHRIHNWRNYISDELAQMWDSFTDVQKAAIARQAERQASAEEWD